MTPREDVNHYVGNSSMNFTHLAYLLFNLPWLFKNIRDSWSLWITNFL